MVLSFTPAAVAADPVEDPARDNGAAIAVEDVAAGAERDEAADGEDAQAGQEVPAGQDVPAEAPPAPAPQPADEPIRVIDLELLEQHSVRVPAYFHDVIQLGQWDGQGLNDIAMIEDNGDLMLYSHDAARSYMSPRRIGYGWKGFTHVMGGGDFNGDGQADILAVKADGKFFLYAGNGQGGFADSRQIGNGWNGMRDIHAGVDFNGDRRTDIVARAQNGDLWLYPGNGKGGFSDSQRIGNGWTGFDQILVVQQGANGNPVIFARQGDMMRAYPTNGRAGFLAPQAQKGGYSWMSAAAASGDWNNDGRSDLVYKNAEGKLYIVTQDANVAFGHPEEKQIGYGWSSFTGLIPARFEKNTKAIWAVDSVGKLMTYFFAAR